MLMKSTHIWSGFIDTQNVLGSRDSLQIMKICKWVEGKYKSKDAFVLCNNPNTTAVLYTDLNPWMPYVVTLEFNKGPA
jgi:hypothetical protein